jgi:hypothetical protein
LTTPDTGSVTAPAFSSDPKSVRSSSLSASFRVSPPTNSYGVCALRKWRRVALGVLRRIRDVKRSSCPPRQRPRRL